MTPTLKPAMHLLILLLLGGSYVSCQEEWCYDKPSCGPATWKNLGRCNGNRQSPVNIVLKNTQLDPCLGPINFYGYENRLGPQMLLNKGDYPDIEMKEGITISSPSLPAKYHLKSFHFHFGTYHRPGSEHAVNGQRYAMELHIVHTKNGISTKEAAKDPEGFAVLAFLIEKSYDAPLVSPWKTLAGLLENIPEKGDNITLQGEFSLGGLLSLADVSTYYRYLGSLTTPPCSEAVIWTVFSEPIKVHPYVVEKFTASLFFTTTKQNRRMQNNFRPVQPLNNRLIRFFDLAEYDPKHCPDKSFGAKDYADCKY